MNNWLNIKMEVNYLVTYISSHGLSKVKLQFSKTVIVISITCIIAGVSQSAPVPKSRERWNPYNYPTPRSLSIPPPTTTTTTTTTTTPTTTTTASPRPRTKRPRIQSADRRAYRSLNTTSNLVTNVKVEGKDQLKFETGNVTAINTALKDFIRAAEVLVRELLISTNTGLLKVIGQVDQGVARFQKRLQGSGFRLALAGQRAAAQTYEALPPFVNKLIQRLGTSTSNDGRSREQLTAQLTDAINNLRQLKRMLSDAFDEHEKDFHSVFQERFVQINKYLGVPELPRRPHLAWHS